MTSSKKILHFTLGPVQGFIADARRVRDLWAGSFLLSWLSGQAMAALVEAGWEIEFPVVDGDALLEAISNGNADATPYIGSLPNRFKAILNADKKETLPEGASDAGALCRQVVQDEWIGLASKVWDQFLTDEVADLGKDGKGAVRAIWDRQVNNFWDVNWVIGDPEFDKDKKPIDDQWLDQRKNWRSHLQLDEPGDLCRLMGRYQELSGFHRIGSENKIPNKTHQQNFWNKLRQQTYTHPRTGKQTRLLNLNIGDDERLCAIALIKRLFPLIANDIIGWQPGGENLSIINWPSVSYIAAVPWLKTIKERNNGAFLLSDAANAENLKSFKGETETFLFGLPNSGIYNLDGQLLHEDGIRMWVKGLKENDRSSALAPLLKALKETQNATGKAKASEFYAILQMDGDQIGGLVRDYPNIVKEGLASFTNKVGNYFDPHIGDKNPSNGVLIYAGGDDVLALVPVNSAMEAAVALQQQYIEAFEEAIKDTETKNVDAEIFTMSASIIYAQYKIPLSAVLKKSHHYLDKIAKDRNGRSSLAIAVMKPGGIAYDWVSCWDGSESNPIASLTCIANHGLGKGAFDKSAEYSSSFFYNIRSRYASLFMDQDLENGETGYTGFADEGFMRAVLTADYKKQFNRSKAKYKDEVDSAINRLLQAGRPLFREEITPRKWSVKQIEHYDFDSALVARFLSFEGNTHRSKNMDGDG